MYIEKKSKLFSMGKQLKKTAFRNFTDEDLRILLSENNAQQVEELKQFFIQKFKLRKKGFFSTTDYVTKLKLKTKSTTAFDLAFQKLMTTFQNSEESISIKFENLLDKELAALLRSNDKNLIRRTENYLAFRFQKMVDSSALISKIREQDIREGIFDTAFEKMIRKIKIGDFNHQSTFKTFFHKIIFNESDSYIRKIMAQKREGDRQQFWDDDDDLLDQLIYSKNIVKNYIEKIDTEYLDIVLDFFKNENPKCHQLILDHQVRQVSFVALAEKTGKTENTLRVTYFNCKKALHEFWKKNQNKI